MELASRRTYVRFSSLTTDSSAVAWEACAGQLNVRALIQSICTSFTQFSITARIAAGHGHQHWGVLMSSHS